MPSTLAPVIAVARGIAHGSLESQTSIAANPPLVPEAARQDYRQVVQQAHEKFSETVRLAMLSLLGFALFCLLITLGSQGNLINRWQ
jgi:hypothetical protein